MTRGIEGFDLESIGSRFGLPGKFLQAEPFGNGHINDTFRVSYEDQVGTSRYIHQRINHAVFHDPPQLMQNVARISEHIEKKLVQQGVADRERRLLKVLPTTDGDSLFRDQEGYYWRTYQYIEGAVCDDVVKSPEQAEAVGRAFGGFQAMLSDLDPRSLHETVPDFHNTLLRFETFQQILEQDKLDRAKSCGGEIEFALSRQTIAGRLVELEASGAIPLRVIHNDTKLNNVLFCEQTREVLCVVDLDTCMPGLSLYDFGDMMRASATYAEEDERDLSKVETDLELFEALTRGYLSEAGSVLLPAEIAELVFSGKLIALELGLRFLSDHLNGDEYFKVHRAGQNLDRCRTQFQLLASMEAQSAELEATVLGLAHALGLGLEPS